MGNKVCLYCGGTGSTKEDFNYCKHCGTRKQIIKNEEVALEEEEKRIGRVLIPNHYKNLFYNKDILLAHSANTTKEYLNYAKGMETYLNHIMQGNRPTKTVFIYSPPGNGKHIFAYSVIKTALNQNISVMPVLDLGEIERYLTACRQDLNQSIVKSMLPYTEDDLYETEILIVTIPYYQDINIGNMLLTLVDRRARRDNTTLILSHQPIDRVINKYDLNYVLTPLSYNDKKFLNILNYNS